MVDATERRVLDIQVLHLFLICLFIYSVLCKLFPSHLTNTSNEHINKIIVVVVLNAPNFLVADLAVRENGVILVILIIEILHVIENETLEILHINISIVMMMVIMMFLIFVLILSLFLLLFEGFETLSQCLDIEVINALLA